MVSRKVSNLESLPDRKFDSPSHDAITYLSQPLSPLLALPCEIRLQIYRHLLVLPWIDPKEVHTSAYRRYFINYPDSSSTAAREALIHPQILSTCRQCFAEATPILYTLNTFTAHPTLLTSFPSLPPIPRQVTAPRVLALIKKWRLRVRLDTDPRFTCEAVAAAFTGAEELEINCCQTMYGGTDPGPVLEMFAAVRGVKKCSVKGSFGREWIERLESSMVLEEDGDLDSERALLEWRSRVQGDGYEVWTHGNR